MRTELETATPKTLEEVIIVLETMFPDSIILRKLDDYEQGKLHGVIEIIRYLKQINKGE